MHGIKLQRSTWNDAAANQTGFAMRLAFLVRRLFFFDLLVTTPQNDSAVFYDSTTLLPQANSRTRTGMSAPAHLENNQPDTSVLPCVHENERYRLRKEWVDFPPICLDVLLKTNPEIHRSKIPLKQNV